MLVRSNRSQLQMPTRANAILTHIIQANFVVIVLKSIRCSESCCFPLWVIPTKIRLVLCQECTKSSRLSLEFQDGSGISIRMHPADEVEVPYVEGAVRAAGQCHRGKQHHVTRCTTAARTARDAPVETIPHYGADDWRLLGEEHVFPISLVKDS